MRAFLSILFLLAAAPLPAAVDAQARRMTIDGVDLRIDPDLPVLTCGVIRTSGDPSVDDQACSQARRQTGTPDATMGFIPDPTGHFVDCFPAEGERTAEFRARCSAELDRIRRMRAMVAIGESRWLRGGDVRRLPIPSGRALVRIGINEQGRPSYCLLIEPREVAGLERALCSRMMSRARFRPAADLQGRPMPSTVQHELSWRTE